MDIRKISIGADYKSSSMHYIVGQPVLGGSYEIHLIKKDLEGIRIWIKKEDEIVCWKEFNNNMPWVIEFNINF